jgi:cell division protein FtsQ
MLSLGRRHQREPRSDLYRRRRASRTTRRAPWLRLAFWLRGNRRVGTKRRDLSTPVSVHAPIPAAGPGVERSSSTLTTQPNDAPPQRPKKRWLPGLLRVLGVGALAGVLGGAGYGASYFLLHSPHFAVRSVRISPTAHVSTEALLERAGVPLGSNLFRVDLAQVQRKLAEEPWIKRVQVQRELPATVSIDIVEYQPRALVALGSLYLADDAGVVFKRATTREAAGLPVITGVGRDAYVADRADSQRQIREALAAVASYKEGGGQRPPIGEVHVDSLSGVVLYTEQGVALHLGQGTAAEWAARLRRFDGVWASLQQSGQRPSVFFLNNRAHPDHVTVRIEE